ncbi:MAG: hypothetical protein AAF557_04685 [Pseudomonadota bacterium]
MRRRPRPPGTQLARAGERTLILTADKPVPEVRFRASSLADDPKGRVEIDRGSGPEVQELGTEVRIDGTGLVAVSIVPEADTAITFLPAEQPGNWPFMIGGMILLAAASLWTLYDFLGG